MNTGGAKKKGSRTYAKNARTTRRRLAKGRTKTLAAVGMRDKLVKPRKKAKKDGDPQKREKIPQL